MASDDKYDGICFTVTACPETIKRGLNSTIPEFMKNMKEVASDAKSLKLFTRGYIGFAMGSEHTPSMEPKRVNEMAQELLEMKVDEIVLQDNIAAGNIEKFEALLQELKVPKEKLAVHFHDSKWNGMDLVIYAMSRGITNIDCAVAGLGQCFYNKTMLGNMVTEEMLFVLDCMGIEHGVLWKPLLDTGDYICEEMTRENCTDAFDVDFEEEIDEYKQKYANLVKSLI